MTLRELIFSLALLTCLALSTAVPVDAKVPPLPNERPDASGSALVSIGKLPPFPTARPLKLGELTRQDAEWRRALRAAEAGQWRAVQRMTELSEDKDLERVLEWLRLRDPSQEAGFQELSRFMKAHPDWPRLLDISHRAELLVGQALSPRAQVAWFEAHPPRTASGEVAYLDALEAAGERGKLRQEVKRVWTDIALNRGGLKRFLRKFGDHLTQKDHERRLDEMLWLGRRGAVAHVKRLTSKEWQRLADARISLRFSTPGVDRAISRVPEELRDNPGLVYERLRWRRRRGRADSARELMLTAPPSDAHEDLWWKERRWHIRTAVSDKKYEDAYLLAASHSQSGGIGLADAEWVAGWVALRFSNRPKDALRHFETLYNGVGSAISRARGAYWAGRASDALGEAQQASDWYSKAAMHPATFYGQLASARLGRPELALTLPPSPSADEKRKFEERSLTSAARALLRVRAGKLMDRFVKHAARTIETPAEYALLAETAREYSQDDLAVYTARWAARKQILLSENAYPVIDLPDELGLGPEDPLVFGLIRQESAFDLDAKSRVGARGLMQLMPATAKVTARSARLPYHRDRLTEDPVYNITLGRTYLQQVIDEYDGYYPLAIAAYNAGPARVDRWLHKYGDPRKPEVDMIDWIESIPFSETRNYVQRVLEGMIVYRARLSARPPRGTVSATPLTGERAVWCLFQCRRKVDDTTRN